MKLIWPPKKTSPKFAHRVTRIRVLMKMISARNARRRRTRHSNPHSAFRNPKFALERRAKAKLRSLRSALLRRASPESFRGWARQDSNLGPRDYESPALTAELQARFRDANIQYSPSNVQHSMSEDGLLGKNSDCALLVADLGWRGDSRNPEHN